MFWNLFKQKPYQKLMDAYKKEGYLAWKLPDTETDIGVCLKEHLDRDKISNDGKKVQDITFKLSEEIGVDASVAGPVFSAGGAYAMFVYVRDKKSA